MENRADKPEHARLRRHMVATQLRRRGVAHEEVLAALEEVPRHLFVPEGVRDEAHGDHPLPIGQGQTISQPYMVARMTELAAPFAGQRALEVGAGSGYQTAILATLCPEVYACELDPELARQCAERIRRLGYSAAVVEERDGSEGWAEQAPYDIILVAAGAPAVPAPLLEQLADGGRLIIPVGGQQSQVLRRITRSGDHVHTTRDTPCRFVDLRGAHGWGDSRT